MHRSIGANCVVCVLTPPGRAAVASVVVEGSNAVDIVSRIFRPAGGGLFDETPLGRIVYGRWSGEAAAEASATGEEVVVCRTTPQRVEVHCHGGKAAAAAIVETLTAAGCREVDWRTWTAATEKDALAAEARIALTEARTLRSAAILLDQYRGALRDAIGAAVTALERGDSEGAARRLDELLCFAPLGLHLTAPWRIVLAGCPNVGKSSLINALVGYRRSIVHHAPGVTRDVVTASTALDGWPVELADTAGLRESADPLEAAGVAKTRGELQKADVALLVFDSAAPWTSEDELLLTAAPGAIIVHNKCDLMAAACADRPPGVATSAVTCEGLDKLKDALLARIAPQVPPPGAAVPFTRRQVEAIHDSLRLIEMNNLARAAACLLDLESGEASLLSRSSA
jgi:tRNA modification GTPase